MNISARTQVCAVFGDPVEHSLSPQIQNAAFQVCGLDFVYVAFHVRKGRLGEALPGIRALGIRGLSVTIPHKLDIIPLLDEVDPAAALIGSVNTVVNDGGRLKGFSTDGAGALRALAAAGVSPAGSEILILGSGGAARAIAFALASLDPVPALTILGIEGEELARLAEDLQAGPGSSIRTGGLTAETLREHVPQAAILVHATPVGMAPKTGECLVPEGLVRAGQTVFDAVYTPLETALLARARNAGAVVVPGLGMFVQQAAIQFEIWTSREAPVEIMTKTVRAALERNP